MVETEVAELPRGIHHSTTKREISSSAFDKALSAIPTHLLDLNEKAKQHSIRPAISSIYHHNMLYYNSIISDVL